MRAFLEGFYALLIIVGNFLKPFLLLIIRVYWGYQFFIGGWDKLHNITPVIEFFTSLGIPLPVLNAYMVGTIECVCGLFLLLGFASRFAALSLTVVMSVAYLTAHYEAAVNIFNDPEEFISQQPFHFLLASLLVFVFGPGAFSIDALLKRYYFKEE